MIVGCKLGVATTLLGGWVDEAGLTHSPQDIAIDNENKLESYCSFRSCNSRLLCHTPSVLLGKMASLSGQVVLVTGAGSGIG
jgi:hypothetical protein